MSAERLETQPVRITGEAKRRLSRMAAERGETVAEFLRRELSAIAFRDETPGRTSGADGDVLLRGLEAVARELSEIRADNARTSEFFEARQRELSRSLAKAFDAVLRASAVDSRSRFTREQVHAFMTETFGSGEK